MYHFLVKQQQCWSLTAASDRQMRPPGTARTQHPASIWHSPLAGHVLLMLGVMPD
jgi:hypothetical protein